MIDPFNIEGPANVSFSGGRTSGYMLRRILDRGAPADMHVLFANTGKEREETLDFVHDVETTWGVPIHWIELGEGDAPFVEVTYETASRKGEPFARLIAKKKFLPNPKMRFCTTELKIRPMAAWMTANGYASWGSIVGLRADEPRRVANLSDRNAEGKDPWNVEMPLHAAGVTKEMVHSFWKTQPFDLRLESWEGNCDLCFLKSLKKRIRIIQDDETRAAWWIEQERLFRATFTKALPSYAKLVQLARIPMLPFAEPDPEEDDGIDCLCTD